MLNVMRLIGIFILGSQFQDSAFHGDTMFWGALGPTAGAILAVLGAIGFAGNLLDSVRDKE